MQRAVATKRRISTVGQVLELTLIRQGKQITRDVTVASRPTIAP
jgi:hypothetical protein